MSITVTLYTFSKRENSTAQPSTGTDYYCVLKQPTSIINPTLELSAADITSYNYAYIAAFGRYYFMKDITSVANNLWQITLEVDPMATYKTQIGNSSEYVLRSASSYDNTIMDSLYPTKAVCTLQEGTSVAVFNTAQITFILGIINNSTYNKAGAVQYLAMNNQQIADFMQYLLGIDIANDTDTLLQLMQNLNTAVQDGIARSLMKPNEFIVESYALPYTPDVDSLVTVKCGWWTTTNTAYVVRPRTNHISIGSGSLALPRHPQASTRGDYLNAAPYTRYTLNLGPFGIYAVDTTKLCSVSTIEYDVYGDNFGNVTCELSAGGVIIDKLTACVKNPFAVGQVNMDALGAMSSGIATASSLSGAIQSGGESGVGSTASNVISSINTLLPQVTRQGSQGNFANVFPNFRSYGEHYSVVDEDLAQRGRPLCQKVTINTLSGYILVSDPDVSIPGTAEENSMIKNYMSNGFFYE